MNKSALFIRHRPKPGQRDEVRRIWEKHVKPRVEANLDHEAYYFCYDDTDPDVICVFQLLSNKEAIDAFMAGAWYPEYLSEVSKFVAKAPQITPASAEWIKG